MADTVASNIVQDTKAEYIIHMTCISDGTGETNVIKIDKSTLLNTSGVEPPAININSIRWAVQGFSYLKLSWDHNTDDVAMILSGNGYDDFSSGAGLKDPRSAGAVGDLLLTSVGATSGAIYDITIACSLQ